MYFSFNIDSLLHFQALMRAISRADAALLTDDRRRMLAGKMNRFYNTGVGAFFTFDTYFLIQDDPAAIPFGQRAGRAGGDTGPLIVAGKAVDGKEFPGQPAQRPHPYRALGIRIALMVHTRADTLAGKTADTFIHIL